MSQTNEVVHKLDEISMRCEHFAESTLNGRRGKARSSKSIYRQFWTTSIEKDNPLPVIFFPPPLTHCVQGVSIGYSHPTIEILEYGRYTPPLYLVVQLDFTPLYLVRQTDVYPQDLHPHFKRAWLN